jgi:hypothetical protein
MPKDLHTQLKGKLALEGSTISAWFRDEAERKVADKPRRRAR